MLRLACTTALRAGMGSMDHVHHRFGSWPIVFVRVQTLLCSSLLQRVICTGRFHVPSIVTDRGRQNDIHCHCQTYGPRGSITETRPCIRLLEHQALITA